ncbi:hypothetical protein Q9L58_008553 [Maublancomyces gigas]|uniref:RNA methyltransferase n=1 Tax=Discina gigas TaxID=1032678 RepID=A0ABR3GAI6_9PEZI
MASHGNYRGYQGVSRHDGQNSASHVVDYRLQVLVDTLPDIFAGKDILDVGCNNGAISVHLGNTTCRICCPATVTGVDIDPELVKKARSHLSFRYSRTAPGETTTGNDPERNNYFPISSVMEHGHRPYPEDPVPTKFPRNVEFHCEDWAKTSISEAGSYDVVLALSMVKWVHLQHLDEVMTKGLREFFGKCHSSLRLSGYFVLEPQEWASYERAVKKNKSLGGNLQKLKIRPEHFESVLKEIGFNFLQKAEGKGLKRNIFIYQKK